AGGALAAAVTLTVALALVAVWLMTPRGHAPAIGASPAATSSPPASIFGSPSASASGPAASSQASQSPLPAATIFAPLSEQQIVVSIGSGFGRLDLRTGSVGPPLVLH